MIPLDEKGLSPRIVIKTGDTPCRRAQLYFALDKGVRSVEELKAANMALQALFRADAVSDPIRVLRLAGTMLIPEEAAPQFRMMPPPCNGMMPPPDSEMIAPPITE